MSGDGAKAQRLLFLCTGNYYRSRFAEAWFNHLAKHHGLSWHAGSRALGLDENPTLSGPMAESARAKLQSLGVEKIAPRLPIQVVESELANASLVIAIKQAEHRHRLAAKHPGWEDRVRYWHVHDVDGATPAVALAELETAVCELIDELTSSPMPPESAQA
ncbi:MAG: hypothetical protein RLN76_06800 [Phycisphaeraceae bacterium]